VERKVKEKAPKVTLAVCEDLDDPDTPDDRSIPLGPILSTSSSQYYMSIDAETHQETLYISSSNQSQPINLQICLDQPIDLEMPKNYVCGETLDLAKPKVHYQSVDLSQFLEPHSNDSYQKQSSTLCLSELSRYQSDPQMPVEPEFRSQSDFVLSRDEHHLSLAQDLIAEDMRIQQHQFNYI
jgi:hypothetical protein